MNMNVCCLVGRLTADPEVKTLSNDQTVCNFSLAVQRNRDKEKTDFINCTAWGQPAKFLGQYGRKGSEATVTGDIRTDKYTDSEGVTHYKTYVVVQNLTLAFSRDNSTGDYKPSENTSKFTYTTTPTTAEKAPEPNLEAMQQLMSFEEVHMIDGELPWF